MQTSRLYRQILKITIVMVVALVHVFCLADGTQDFNKLTLQTVASSAGNSGPSSVYIASKNQYFVVYSDFDPTCATKQKLYGVYINALTGLPLYPAFAISECGKKAFSPNVAYNNKQNEFAVIYKLSDGGGTKIYVQTISASNNAVGQPVELANINLGDPYESLSIEYVAGKDRYVTAFHEVISTAVVKLQLNYINALNNSLLAYDTKIDKTIFPITCEGVKHARLLPLADNIFATMEIQFADGNEIWGAFFNPETGVLDGDYFQISPGREAETYYINPSPALNSDTKEILVLYEKSHLQISTAALSNKIHGQLIHHETGAKISPLHQVITTLPSGIDPEDVKWPQAVFSRHSNEFLVTFYGERWINANSNYYGIYVQRINGTNLSVIGTPSTLVTEDAGDAIVNNNYLRPLSLAHNSLNNQYLLGWSNHNGNNVSSQIWRYDSNRPTDLAITTNSQNENLAIGTTFTTISAKDIDPENATLVYSLVSGTGGDDNSFFTISGNALKVAKKLDFEVSSTRKVRLRATDSHGLSVDKAFVLTIKNVNDKPTGISLAGNLTVDENKPAGTFMANINALDQDVGDTHNFTLVTGDSATNNANFTIEAGKLKLVEPLDFELTPKQLVRIRATDQAGLWVEKGFMIAVLDVNERPESIQLNKNDLPESDVTSTILISVKDPDASSNYSYAFASGEGDSDNDLFLLQNNLLKPAQAFDFELKSNYMVRIKAFDGIFEIEQDFLISITNVNDKPDSITLSTNKLQSDSPLGTLVCDLHTIDQDSDDSHTYSLIEGQNIFFINGAQLRIFEPLSYDEFNPSNNLYPIKIKSTDLAGASCEKTFQIEVVLYIDDEKPAILNFDNNQLFITKEAATFNLSINATDNEKLDTVYLYYRPIRSIDSFSNGTNLLSTKKIDPKLYQIDASIPGTLADEMGLSYYFKVYDAAGNVDSTEIAYAYTSYSQIVMEPTAKTYTGTAESYQIIANPFVLENSKLSDVFAQYPASGSDTWRLFKFENQQNKEIGQSTSELLALGKGYWFNKSKELNSPITFDKAHAPAYHDGNLYVLQLNKGWNLIGNPYPFAISWEDVMLSNNLPIDSLTLYTFKRTYQESKVLGVFEGGFVFTENAISLSVPLHKNSLSGGRIAEEDQEENAWTVRLTLDNGYMKNTLAGIGMHRAANESFDKYDRPALPRFIHQPVITFNHPEHFSGAFSRDIVAWKENHIWEFEASAGDGKHEITMYWNTSQLKQTGKKLMLYNVSNDELVDMLVLDSYVIKAGQSTTFKVIYGEEAFARESFEKLKTIVLLPYPNPFNQSVRFPIHLPSTSGSYQVECTVYDVFGEKVFVKNEQKIDGGLYQLTWDENPGLCQGIYIYDIKVTSGLTSQSFHGRVIKY